MKTAQAEFTATIVTILTKSVIGNQAPGHAMLSRTTQHKKAIFVVQSVLKAHTMKKSLGLWFFLIR